MVMNMYKVNIIGYNMVIECYEHRRHQKRTQTHRSLREDDLRAHAAP